MNKPVVLGIILFLIVFCFLLLLTRQRPVQRKSALSSASSEKEADHLSQRRINAKLFFNDGSSSLLATEDRSILYSDTLQGQATIVLNELMQGPHSNLVAVIPEGTVVRELFLTKDGTAYVDFSPELANNAQGGSTVEINTVYSVVDTLTLNFPSIKRVQILIDGRAVDTLNGHLDLSRPLVQDMSIVRTGEGGRHQPETAPVQEAS